VVLGELIILLPASVGHGEDIEMIEQITLWILIVCGSVAVVVGLQGYFLFSKYSERVAEIKGQVDERNSLARGELGLNSFEIDRFGEILSRRYKLYGDVELNQIGDRLIISYVFQLVLFILLVGGIVLRNQ